MDAPKYRLRTLGPLSLECEGQPVSGLASQRKRLALLAVLAAAGDVPVPRDKILLYLWPESDSERARNTLYQFMHVLRRELGDVVVATNGDLTLNAELIAADVVDFRSCLAAGEFAQAAELYRGPFLDGVYLRETPEFEHWLDGQRSELASGHVRALDELASAAARANAWNDCVQWRRAQANADPLSSRVARLYMEALAAVGNREGAIKHAQVHAALVRAELGAAPDDAIERYARQLTVGDSDRALLSSVPEKNVAATDMVVTDAAFNAVAPAGPSRPRPAVARVRRSTVGTVLLFAGIITALSFAARPRSRPDLIIVTPFANETGDSALNVLGLVLANSVTQGLAATGRLSVGDFQTVLRTLPRAGRGMLTEASTAAAVRESGAGWVVSGTVRGRGDSLFVDVRVLRGPNGDVVSTLDPIAVRRDNEAGLIEHSRQSVVGAMAALHDATFDAWDAAPGILPQYTAEQEYTLGLDALTRDDAAMARQHFRQAVQLDPHFAAPRFELLWNRDAQSDSMLADLNAQRDRLSSPQQMDLEIFNAFSRNDLEAAFQWAERRAAAAPDDPGALLMLQSHAYFTNRFAQSIAAVHSVRRFPAWRAGSFVVDINAHHMAGDFTAALRESREGRARYPQDWMYCSKEMEQHAALGHVHEADSIVVACDALSSAGPDRGWPYFLMGQELLAHGHGAEAERVFSHCIALRLAYAAGHPDGSGGRARLASQCYAARADWKHAYDLLRTEYANYPNVDKGHMDLGIAAAHVGDTATATKMLRWHEAQTGADADHLWYRAGILVALGRRDDAIELLRQAARGGSPAIMAHINNVRAFEPLAADERFRSIVAPRER